MRWTSILISTPATVVTFMLVGHSYAETASSAADLQASNRIAAYIESRPMQEVLFRLGVEQDRKFGIQVECKSHEVKPLAIVILSPIDLPDDKQNPTKGTWLFRYALNRCGETKAYNVLFGANGEGGTPKSLAYYPGTTNAHPVLVRDAMVSAMASAMVRSGIKDCRSAEVFDMRVTEQPHSVREGEKEFKGVWSETWTFKACNQTVEIPITFTPDIGGGGTSFKMSLR